MDESKRIMECLRAIARLPPFYSADAAQEALRMLVIAAPVLLAAPVERSQAIMGVCNELGGHAVGSLLDHIPEFAAVPPEELEASLDALQRITTMHESMNAGAVVQAVPQLLLQPPAHFEELHAVCVSLGAEVTAHVVSKRPRFLTRTASLIETNLGHVRVICALDRSIDQKQLLLDVPQLLWVKPARNEALVRVCKALGGHVIAKMASQLPVFFLRKLSSGTGGSGAAASGGSDSDGEGLRVEFQGSFTLATVLTAKPSATAKPKKATHPDSVAKSQNQAAEQANKPEAAASDTAAADGDGDAAPDTAASDGEAGTATDADAAATTAEEAPHTTDEGADGAETAEVAKEGGDDDDDEAAEQSNDAPAATLRTVRFTARTPTPMEMTAGQRASRDANKEALKDEPEWQRLLEHLLTRYPEVGKELTEMSAPPPTLCMTPFHVPGGRGGLLDCRHGRVGGPPLGRCGHW